MPQRNLEKTIQMLDMLLEFFGEEGQHWTAGELRDSSGRRCVVGAITHLRAVMNMHGDTAGYYLQKAACRPPDHIFRRVRIAGFNDGCENYGEVRAWILKARELAQADLDVQRDRQGYARSRHDSALVQIEGEEAH